MDASQLQNRSFTFQEYLKFEEAQTDKYEYLNGEIVMMAKPTTNHSLIISNTGTALNNAIESIGKDCLVVNSDVKVYIEAANHGVYPDVLALCEDFEHYENEQSIITNPMLVMEVLSKSTAAYDRGLKFEKYRSLPSFKEYVLFWQTIPKALSWYKESTDMWRISRAEGLNSNLFLHSIGANISLEKVYKYVKNLEAPTDFVVY